MDIDESHAVTKELLEYFVSEALGLTLYGRIHDASDVPAGHRACFADPDGKPCVWAAWQTNKGPVSACAAYDHQQALQMSAHVLWITWWIALCEHHEGWWRCYPKRPREWIKGLGAQDNPPSS